MHAVRVPMESLIEVILLQLEKGGKANLTITGSSMMPMLQEYRDSVLLVSTQEALRPGDIALYQRDNGSYILHRVIRLSPQGYLFCGDNQAELESVRQDQIIARVDGFFHNGKYHELTETGYRLYCWVWLKLFCVRKYYLWLRRRLGRLRRGLFNRRNFDG